MNGRGTISLYYGNELVQIKSYSFKQVRQRIINRWVKTYGWRFLKCAIHIEPIIKEDEPKEEKIIEEKTWKRPPTIYDNKTYNY